MRQITLETVTNWFTTLEVNYLARARSVPSAQQLDVFEQAKSDAHSNFKRLARQHHPDVGGDAEHFKKLSEAWNALSKVTLKPNLPRPPVARGYTVRVVSVSNLMWSDTMWSGTSTSTTGTGGWF